MDWTFTHLEGLKDMCKHQIEISQPLPREAVSQSSVTNHEHVAGVITSNRSDTVIKITPEQNVTASEFLDFVDKLSCLNECSGHGQCVNGKSSLDLCSKETRYLGKSNIGFLSFVLSPYSVMKTNEWLGENLKTFLGSSSQRSWASEYMITEEKMPDVYSKGLDMEHQESMSVKYIPP